MQIERIPFDDSLTGKIWGGLFFNPRYTTPASDILRLSGDPCFIRHEGIPKIALSLLRKERFLARTATTPLLFQYYGALFFENNPPLSLMKELDLYIAKNVDFAIFSFPPDFPYGFFESAGWKMQRSLTLACGEEELARWGRGFRDDVKNKIRKAEREAVKIDEAEYLPDRLWSVAYTRKSLKTPIDSSNLKTWCEKLRSNSLLRIFVARIDNEPIAFRGQLILGDFAYDWIAGSDPEFHATGANQLLMAEIGNQIAEAGVKTWDLVGGQIRSIYDFKKSFGAREQTHYIGKKYFNGRGRLFSYLRYLRHGG